MNVKNMNPSHNNPYDLLHQLGVSSNYKGFFHTAHAVTLCMQQQERLLLVTKWLYPDVAKHYGTNWRAVERNIRTASAIAWERNRPLLEALAQRRLKRRPRSTEFLALLFHAVQPKELMTGGLEQP